MGTGKTTPQSFTDGNECAKKILPAIEQAEGEAENATQFWAGLLSRMLGNMTAAIGKDHAVTLLDSFRQVIPTMPDNEPKH
jgi:hypothetical protein